MALPLKHTTSEISDQAEHRCSLAKYPALRISSITQFMFITDCDCYKEREREREREREIERDAVAQFERAFDRGSKGR